MCCFDQKQFILLLFVFVVQIQAEKCTTPNTEQGECISLSSCTALNEALQKKSVTEEYVEALICGGTRLYPKVCCVSLETTDSVPDQTNVTKENLLPSRRHCGYQHSDDYPRRMNDMSIRITEFPWLARIIHSDINGVRKYEKHRMQFGCSGSLINNRYVLTAAHCLVNKQYIPLGVRLGEYYINNKTDCIQEIEFEQECSDVEDFGIEKTIYHTDYNEINHNNDIGLVRLNRTVTYSEYIRPICLPLPGTKLANFGDVLTSSGWGKTVLTGEAEIKKKIFSTLITTEECIKLLQSTNDYFRIKGFITITENQLCTILLQNNTDFQCKGDGGGPVMFSHRAQWHQEGIVSAGILQCGYISLPEAMTKVVNYLEWIKGNLEP